MKRAMSMIELVIAIVVMGIVVASTPLLLQQTSSSTTTSVVRQESIMEASTQVWRAMIRDWDKHSYHLDGTGIGKALIIATDSNNNFFNDRNGTVSKSGRRSQKKTVNATPKDEFGMEQNSTIADALAIEDLNGLTINLESNKALYGDPGELDYVFKDAGDINATMGVSYMDDSFTGIDFNGNSITIALNPHSFMAGNSSSHIKVVATTIRVADVDGDGNEEQTVLYSFASNIGESAPSKIIGYVP